MNILIIDEGTHFGSTGHIVYILQFLIKYLESYNIDYLLVKNIYISIKKKDSQNLDILYEKYDDKIIDKQLVLNNNCDVLKTDFIYNNFSQIILNKFKFLSKKIRFNSILYKNVTLNTGIKLNEILNKNDYLSVHFRFTDMKVLNYTYSDYLHIIKDIVNKEAIKTIFVASDNFESILKLEKDLKHLDVTILYNNNKFIANTEIEDSFTPLNI